MQRIELYPTRHQATRLQMCLDVCRQLYNELREADARIAAVYRELQDAALHKLDLAFRAFFRRVRAGQAPGFPRFRAAARYTTLEFPHGNRALKLNTEQNKMRIPGVGTVRVRKGAKCHRLAEP